MEDIDFTLPTENEVLLNRIDFCLETLEYERKNGNNVESDYNSIIILKEEISSLTKRLEAKKSEYLLMEYAILIRYHPMLARTQDFIEYQRLAKIKSTKEKLPVKNRSQNLDEFTNSFNEIFVLMFDLDKILKELLRFLVDNNYVDGVTTESQLSSFLKLESVYNYDKIIWTDSFRGKVTSKVICFLVTTLFNYKDNTKGKYKQRGAGYSDIIMYYFNAAKSSFKLSSLDSSLSKISSDTEDTVNPRQVLLENKLNELYRI